jgi:hypothetical protein
MSGPTPIATATVTAQIEALDAATKDNKLSTADKAFTQQRLVAAQQEMTYVRQEMAEERAVLRQPQLALEGQSPGTHLLAAWLAASFVAYVAV